MPTPIAHDAGAISDSERPPTRMIPSARVPILLAIAAVATMRLPTLADPHYYTDEGIFAAVAQRLLAGHALYTGAWDDKPPLIYWTYTLILGVFGPSMVALRLAAAIAAAVCAAGVALIGTRLGGRAVGLWAGAICAVVTALPVVEGNLALTELFGAAPAVWATALVLVPVRLRGRHVVAAGALLAAAFLFKQVFLLDVVAVTVLLVGRRNGGIRQVAWLACGFAVVCGLVAAVLAVQGGLGEGIYASYGFYLLYLRDGSGGHIERWLVCGIALALSLVILRCPNGTSLHSVTLWFSFSLAGTLVGGRPYGHYLLQAVAPASLWLPLWAQSVPRRDRQALLLGTAGCAAALLTAWSFLPFFQRDRTVTLAYYANIARYVLGREDAATFRSWYTWRVAAQDGLISAMSDDPDRTLFVWGEYPWLYPLARAENPTRFSTSFHFSFVPGSRKAAIAELRQTPPRFIIWEGDEWRRLPGLDELISDRYELVTTVAESRLYRRR